MPRSCRVFSAVMYFIRARFWRLNYTPVRTFVVRVRLCRDVDAEKSKISVRVRPLSSSLSATMTTTRVGVRCLWHGVEQPQTAINSRPFCEIATLTIFQTPFFSAFRGGGGDGGRLTSHSRSYPQFFSFFFPPFILSLTRAFLFSAGGGAEERTAKKKL